MPTESSPWEFLPLSRSLPPAATGERSTKGRMRQLQRFVRDLLPAKPDLEGPTELDSLDEERLAELTPALDPTAGAAVLAAALGDWAAEPAGRGPRAVVAPPGWQLPEVLAELARERGWPEIEPPTRAALIAGDDLVAADPGVDPRQPRVVRELDRWLWRTETGLPRIRRLLETILSHEAPVLVGCGSWSWAFLRHAAGIEGLLGEPLATAPLDDRQLERWLAAPLRTRGLECRQTADRKLILGGDDGSEADDPPPVSPFFSALAGASRGIPGVAAALWRRGLRSHDEAEESGEEEMDPERTYWARRLEEMEIQPSGRLQDLDRFVAQAVLLHGGLPGEALEAVLPFSAAEVQGSVRQLTASAVLTEDGGELTVALAAYGPLRKLLAADGQMVDDL